MSQWDELNSWNVAIRDVAYEFENAGKSVYLDLDDEVFDRILRHEALAGKTKTDLYTDVQAILNFNASADLVLESLRIRSRDWVYRAIKAKDADDVPPMLAFLAVTVAAAEEMGSGETDANAYYAHLCRLLQITYPSTDASKLQTSYRLLVEDLWSYLNRWLIDIGYRRGVPTAYAITQRFVGIPVSQALVRETDRKRLPEMFYFYGLSPANPISISEMEELVSLWIMRDEFSVSAAVRRLWLDPQAREQICIAFCEELTNWDGLPVNPPLVVGGRQEQAIHSRKLTIGAWFSNQLGVKSLETALLAPASYAATESTWSLSHEGNTELVFSRLNDAYFEAPALGASTTKSILNSILELKDPNSQTFRREPTTIIALSFDDSTQGFLEVKRLSAGQDAMLLVKDHKNLLMETKAFLDRNARPGYEALGPTTRGVPEGWWLFRNVQITEIDNQLSSPADKEKFSALIPTGLPQLVLAGGVRLPGYRSLNQWLADAPPEIRALSQTVPSIRVTIEASDVVSEGAERILEIASDAGVIVANLKDLDLQPGNYLGTLFEGSKPVLSRRFTLASGEEPNFLLKTNSQRLTRDLAGDSSKALFSASKNQSLEGMVLGSLARHALPEPEGSVEFTRTAEWIKDEPDSTEEIVELDLADLDANSCFYRGNHYWVIPGFGPGAHPESVIAPCRDCQSLSVQNLSARRAERAKEAGRSYLAVRNIRASAIRSIAAPVVEETPEFDWKLLRSVLNFSVAGGYTKLVETIKQLGEQSHTASEVLDFLDQLGYIEIERDAHGRGVYWCLTPTQVVKQCGEDEEFFFLGATPKSMLNQILSESKGSGENPVLDQSGAVIKIRGVSEGTLKAVCADADVYYSDSSDGDVLKALPALSLYEREAMREVIPSADSIAMFAFDTGAWQDEEALQPGAIRLKTKVGFKYFFVPTFAELEQGMAISCSATVSKYLLARSQGSSFISYRDSSSTLYVPLGAKIPGLYARPALLCNPQMPKRATMSRKDGSNYTVYKYPNVPKSIAQGLANRLAS